MGLRDLFNRTFTPKKEEVSESKEELSEEAKTFLEIHSEALAWLKENRKKDLWSGRSGKPPTQQLSDALVKIAEAIMPRSPTASYLNYAYTAAGLAWNLALMPDEAREGLMDRLIAAEEKKSFPPEIIQGLYAMIRRKESWYADERLILARVQAIRTSSGLSLQLGVL